MSNGAGHGILAVIHAAFVAEYRVLRIEGELLEGVDPTRGKRPDFAAFFEDSNGSLEHRGAIANQGFVMADVWVLAEIGREQAAAIDTEGGNLGADAFIW